MANKKQKKMKAKEPMCLSLQLDAAIYRKAALLRAAKAFAHLANFEFERQGKTWMVSMQVFEPGLAERMADEFANHVLAAQVAQW